MEEVQQHMQQSNTTDLAFSDEDNIEHMYLTFSVASEEYGVGIATVTEIVGMQRIMPVPDVPHYIKGVINLRGKVIPLMDMRVRFGLEEKAYDERTVVIVLEVADAPIGLIVDGVREVREILPGNVDAPSYFNASGDKAIVKGLGRVEDRVTVILDVDALVSSGEFDIHAEVDAHASPELV